MTQEAHEIVEELKKFHNQPKGGAVWETNTAMSFLTFRTARLQVLLAEEQEKSAVKLEQETARLVEETVELRRLTRGLYIFTIAVAIFAVIQIVIMLLEYCSKLHGSP